MAKKKTLSTAAMMKRWREPGAAGFFAFLEDAKPMIPSEKSGFQVYEVPSDLVRAEIEKMLDPELSTIVICWPRRHGKTVVAALIIVWRFLSRLTQNVAIVANSQTQTVDTAFRLIRTIVEQTGYTRELIEGGALRVVSDTIEYPALGNRIQGFPGNAASLYGKKITIAQVSELHAARSDDVYQTLASATVDTDDGLVIVDSTVGPMSSPLHGLYSLHEAGLDPALYFSHIAYRDVEDAIARGPAWIKPARLRSRSVQMLSALFAQQHLNQWGSASNAAFTPEVIERCKDEYPLDPKAIAEGRAYVVGGGLDRSGLFSKNGDRTVFAAVMKVTGEDGEPHYYVVEDHEFLFPVEAAVKARISRAKAALGMTHIGVEQYQAQDVRFWASTNGLEAELIHAGRQQQAAAFTTIVIAAQEGRLHIHPKFETLFSEMATFQYELVSSGTSEGTVPVFEHAKGKHDDHVYAMTWAAHATRAIELNPYEVNGIHCHAGKSIAALCVLNGGNLVPSCNAECRSFQSIHALYHRYRNKTKYSEMSIEDFIAHKVKNVGIHTSMR